MATETIEFIQGEKKDISIEVHSVYNDSFNITSGTFNLLDSDGDTVVNETATRYVETVNGSEICREIYYTLDTTNMSSGKYTGTFTYVVNTEILKYRFTVSILD
jgi:hypothetical protein